MRRRYFLFVALVTACGEHGESPPPDCNAFCEPPPPPPVAPISLRITNGAPVEGVQVIFVEEFGRTIATVTDSIGVAQITTDRAATVTVINPFGQLADGRDDIRTIVGARPFDSLALDAPPRGEIVVNVVAPDDPQAARYELHTTCGNASFASETGTAVLRDCNAFIDLMWISFAADDTPLREITLTSIPVSDGATLALTSNSYVAMPEHRIDYSVVPEGFDRIVGRASVRASSAGTLFERDFEATISQGVGTTRVIVPSLTSGFTMFDSKLAPRPGDITQHGVLDWNPPSTGPRQFIDFFNVLTPSVVARPELVQASHISWTESVFKPLVFLESSIPDAPDPISLAPDFVAFDLAVTRGERRWRWTLIAPYEGPLVALPVTTEEFTIQVGDTVTFDRMRLARVPGRYNLVRQSLLTSQRIEDLRFASESGRIVYQEL